MRLSGPELRRQSVRVALAATIIVAIVYCLISVAVVGYVTRSLTDQVDARLLRAVEFVSNGPPHVRPAPLPPPETPLGPEQALWIVAPDGTLLAGQNLLVLPEPFRLVSDPTTVAIGGTEIRVAGARFADGTRVVIGESLHPVNQARETVILGELLIAPVLLVSVFIGAVAIGRRVAAPIEAARQRQLDFTADASHELRTPLSVIEANASLALTRERDTGWYRAAFEKVDAESKRMRRLLDDLLWLARFDSTRGQPNAGPVDLGILAAQAVDRFGPVAEAKQLALHLDAPDTGATVNAPAEWLDRLLGVLLDNACKYSPERGAVTVRVAVGDSRVGLSVDDTGPGIPESERDRIFDRFHRVVEGPSGAGLGLAIADAIARATSGRWSLTTSPGGGARVSVTWPRGGARPRTEPVATQHQTESAHRG